jgi:hypothetical protein
VLLTRDKSKASGVFYHEEVSEAIFDEINNVIDTNSILARGPHNFVLGLPLYYRIYAERNYVKQPQNCISMLYCTSVNVFYAPHLYWLTQLSIDTVSKNFAQLYFYPKNPTIHILIRAAILFGRDFCDWLLERWNAKWKRISQPPSFYFTFKEMLREVGKADPLLVALRTSSSKQFYVHDKEPVRAHDLLKDPRMAASLLSDSCMKFFRGDSSDKTISRYLDYFAYGNLVQANSKYIEAIQTEIGDKLPNDLKYDDIES